MKHWATGVSIWSPSGYDSEGVTWCPSAEIAKSMTEGCLHECMGRLLTASIDIESFTITPTLVFDYSGKIAGVSFVAVMIASVTYDDAHNENEDHDTTP